MYNVIRKINKIIAMIMNGCYPRIYDENSIYNPSEYKSKGDIKSKA